MSNTAVIDDDIDQGRSKLEAWERKQWNEKHDSRELKACGPPKGTTDTCFIVNMSLVGVTNNFKTQSHETFEGVEPWGFLSSPLICPIVAVYVSSLHPPDPHTPFPGGIGKELV